MDSRMDSDFAYVDGRGNVMRSRAELAVARMLSFLGIEYEYDARIEGSELRADFSTGRGLIEVVDSEADAAKYSRIRSERPEIRIAAVGRPRHGARAGDLNEISFYEDEPESGSIFIEDPSFAFDYAHILPLVEKCSILHGHTSSIMVELAGRMTDNLVMDFGEAKRMIRSAVARFDHKFFINEKYLKSSEGGHYRVAFDGPRGAFDLTVPSDTAYLLRGEATVENLSSELVRILTPMLPDNIEAVGVYIYEGHNKGSHIISSVARGG